mgnify:CR=1 FL=1
MLTSEHKTTCISQMDGLGKTRDKCNNSDQNTQYGIGNVQEVKQLNGKTSKLLVLRDTHSKLLVAHCNTICSMSYCSFHTYVYGCFTICHFWLTSIKSEHCYMNIWKFKSFKKHNYLIFHSKNVNVHLLATQL